MNEPFDPETLIGLPLAEAQRKVEEAGYRSRIVERGQAITGDHKSDRVTGYVDADGKVAKARIG